MGLASKPIELSTATDYRVGETVPWVKVEKYLFGTVENMGGVQKANDPHPAWRIRASVVLVGTNQEYLKEQQENRLYRKLLVPWRLSNTSVPVNCETYRFALV